VCPEFLNLLITCSRASGKDPESTGQRRAETSGGEAALLSSEVQRMSLIKCFDVTDKNLDTLDIRCVIYPS
jgi:hypothetical protein